MLLETNIIKILSFLYFPCVRDMIKRLLFNEHIVSDMEGTKLKTMKTSDI